MIPKLLENIQDVNFECRIQDNDRSMLLQPTTEEEISRIIQNLKNRYSCGDDEIPTKIIKECKEELNSILSYIINNSFKYCIFPDQLKIGLIHPIYKKGDK